MASDLQKKKKKLDSIFSKYIRLRDSDNHGNSECITCGKIGFWEKDKIQCGHFIHRGVLITRFDEENCHAQCSSCNLWKNKNLMQMEYRDAMVTRYGEKRTKEIEMRRFKTTKLDTLWYEEKIKYYNEEVKKLLASKKFENEESI